MQTMNPSLSASPVAQREATSRAPRSWASDARVDLSGPVLGARYRLLRPLGAIGEMTMYEAEDVNDGKRVAVRLLADPHRGPMALRYLVETRAAINLSHPNIIQILDFGRDIVGEGDPVGYLVMEFLEGESLAAMLELDGPLHWTQVLEIGRQVCLALIEAHEQSIVHCNIAPETCFRVPRHEAPDLIKVLDFGNARFPCRRTGICSPSDRVGAPGLMAPELLTSEPFDRRVDIYGLGLLMYRLCTDRMPYAPELRQTDPTPMRRSVDAPPAFEALVLKALALDPGRRHVDAQAMYDAIVAVEASVQASSRLPRDPLYWDGEERAEVSHSTLLAASSSALTDPYSGTEDSSPSWPLARPWPEQLMRATLALAATTMALRTAWTLLS